MILRTDSLLNLSSCIETRIATEDFASAPPIVVMGVTQVDDNVQGLVVMLQLVKT